MKWTLFIILLLAICQIAASKDITTSDRSTTTKNTPPAVTTVWIEIDTFPHNYFTTTYYEIMTWVSVVVSGTDLYYYELGQHTPYTLKASTSPSTTPSSPLGTTPSTSFASSSFTSIAPASNSSAPKKTTSSVLSSSHQSASTSQTALKSHTPAPTSFSTRSSLASSKTLAGTRTSQPASSTTVGSPAQSTTSSSSSDTGSIAASVLGGLIAGSVLLGLIIWHCKQKRKTLIANFCRRMLSRFRGHGNGDPQDAESGYAQSVRSNVNGPNPLPHAQMQTILDRYLGQEMDSTADRQNLIPQGRKEGQELEDTSASPLIITPIPQYGRRWSGGDVQSSAAAARGMPEPRFPKLYSPYRPRLSTQPTMSSIDETIDPSSSSKSSSSNYDVYNSYGSRMPDNLQRHVNGTHPSSLPLALQAGRRSGQNAGTIRRLHETNVNPLPFEFTPGDDAAFTAIKLPRAENQNGASGVNGTGTRPSSLPLPSQTNPDLLNDMIGGGGRSGAVQGGGAIQRKSERSLKEVEKRARNSLWKENYDNACGEISEHY